MLHLLTRPQRLVIADFYQTESGREPVREWLKTLSPTERQAIGKDVRKVEYGWPLGMPTCAPIGDGLWEIRTHLTNRIARIFLCFVREKMILLHGFIKKSRVAPLSDITLARDRKTDLENRLRRPTITTQRPQP
jgi:phage-related protein